MSFKNIPWIIEDSQIDIDGKYYKDFHLSAHVKKTIEKRIFNETIKLEELENYLHPTIKKMMPEPYKFHHMEKAVLKIAEHMIDHKKIAILGDYDVDGATSTALMASYFKDCCKVRNKDYTLYIPDRVKEGYGPNIEAFKQLIDEGYELIITLDCGISAFDEVEYANERGITVIIIDHHAVQEKIPNAFAVVNPKCENDQSGCEYLSAVGVSFIVLVALNRFLEQNGYFLNQKKPDLMQYMDLVALGTVADVMPLIQLNRAFVKTGLHIMNRKKQPYIDIIKEMASVTGDIQASHLGFTYGPRINASGRVGEPYLGTEILLCEDQKKARVIAQKLEYYNKQRKDMEQDMCMKAEKHIKKILEQKSEYAAWAEDCSFHQGVIGIVASRMKDKFYRPSIIAAIDGDITKASARSVKGFDIGEFIEEAKKNNLLLAGGGHAMAAGFSFETKQSKNIQDLFQKIWKQKKNLLNTQSFHVDIVVDANHIGTELAESLEILQPFGVKNPRPHIMIKQCLIDHVNTIKSKHVMINFSNDHGKKARGISFNAMNDSFGRKLLSMKRNAHYDILGTIQLSHYQNKRDYSFIIEDVRIA